MSRPAAALLFLSLLFVAAIASPVDEHRRRGPPRTSATPQFLRIKLTGRYPANFKVDFSPDFTGIQLAQKVAEEFGGIEYQYVVLYRLDRPAKLLDPNGATINLDRSEGNRIDNSNMTLAQLKVNNKDTIQCLLRPLRGDHIHLAFTVYYKGEQVDMSVVEDRPVLAVQSNLRVGETYQTCSPVEPGAQGGAAAPLDLQSMVPGMDSLPRFLGPRVWEGGHIDTAFPHFGIHFGHTHWFGFGLIHVHPATSWHFFEETEGLGANLDAALEQAGIWLWEKNSRRYPYHSAIGHIVDENNVLLDFPGVGVLTTVNGTVLTSNLNWSFCDYPTTRTLISNDDEYVWRLYYHRYAKDNTNFAVLEENLGRVWLHHNMGFIALSYELRNSTLSSPIPTGETLDYLFSDNTHFKMHDPVTGEIPSNIPSDSSSFNTMGFDGTLYPAPYQH